MNEAPAIRAGLGRCRARSRTRRGRTHAGACPARRHPAAAAFLAHHACAPRTWRGRRLLTCAAPWPVPKPTPTCAGSSNPEPRCFPARIRTVSRATACAQGRSRRALCSGAALRRCPTPGGHGRQPHAYGCGPEDRGADRCRGRRVRLHRHQRPGARHRHRLPRRRAVRGRTNHCRARNRRGHLLSRRQPRAVPAHPVPTARWCPNFRRARRRAATTSRGAIASSRAWPAAPWSSRPPPTAAR